MSGFSRRLAAVAPLARNEIAHAEENRVQPVRTREAEGERISIGGPRHEETGPREEFRVLKRHLIGGIGAGGGGLDRRVILVTSASPGEGKTTVTLGLALSFMLERDCRVVLVDADARARGLTQRMKLDRKLGLLDYLDDDGADLAEVLYRTSTPGIDVVPIGQPRVTAPELLGSPRMEHFLHELRGGDGQPVAIIDSSSVLSCTETVAIAAHAGQILFVTARAQTRRQEVDEAIAVLHRAAGPLDDTRISLVLNKADRRQSLVRYAIRR